jgi:hypothetical protein
MNSEAVLRYGVPLREDGRSERFDVWEDRGRTTLGEIVLG